MFIVIPDSAEACSSPKSLSPLKGTEHGISGIRGKFTGRWVKYPSPEEAKERTFVTAFYNMDARDD